MSSHKARRTARGLIAALTVVGAAFGPADAQDGSYPNQPIKVINGFPAGGLIDTMTRIVTDKMAATLGQPFSSRTGPARAGRSPPRPSRAQRRTATRS